MCTQFQRLATIRASFIMSTCFDHSNTPAGMLDSILKTLMLLCPMEMDTQPKYSNGGNGCRSRGCTEFRVGTFFYPTTIVNQSLEVYSMNILLDTWCPLRMRLHLCHCIDKWNRVTTLSCNVHSHRRHEL